LSCAGLSAGLNASSSCVYNFDVHVCVQRRRLRETVLTTSSDATMERALTDRCDVTDATIVLTAATNSVVVSILQCQCFAESLP